MIVAQEKRRSNIAEYILYMWQIEDSVRALEFDFDRIKTLLIDKYEVDNLKRIEIENWYRNLLLMLQKEQKTKDGHLQFLTNLVNDLNQFHLALVEKEIDQAYSSLFKEIDTDIKLLRQSANRPDDNDVLVALNALYYILMFKLKGNELTEGTQQAIWRLGNFLGQLSLRFKAYELGELNFD